MRTKCFGVSFPDPQSGDFFTGTSLRSSETGGNKTGDSKTGDSKTGSMIARPVIASHVVASLGIPRFAVGYSTYSTAELPLFRASGSLCPSLFFTLLSPVLFLLSSLPPILTFLDSRNTTSRQLSVSSALVILFTLLFVPTPIFACQVPAPMVAPSQAILPGLATSKTASQSHTIQPPNHVFAIDDRQLDIREIERHIHQLGSSDYYQREEAKNWLTEHGQEVYPFLQKYVNDQNLEIRMSVRFLIEEQKIVAQKQHEKDFLVDWENKVPLTGWLRFQKFIAKASPPSKKLDQPKAIPTNGSRVVAKDKLASPSAPSPENDLELSLRLFYLQLYKHNKDGIEALETNDKKRLRNVEANLILFTRTVNGNMANLPIEDNDSSAASIQKYRLAFFLYYALSAERYYLTSLANSYAYTVLPYIPAYLPSQSSPSPNEEIGYRALLIAPFYITKGPIFDEKTPLDKTLLRNYYHNLVLFGLRNNFPETILSARKVLKNVNATTYYHQLPDAFEALVLFSDKSDVASFVRDIALVDQFLGDRKALFNGRSQTPPFRTHVIQRQDLALLTLVRMTGQNPVDYHFRNLYGNQGSHLAYSQYSTFFSSEADRTDAIERWNKWKTKKPFEKSSDNK